MPFNKTSQQDGFATAKLELLNGYPGYFYQAGDGDFICGVEKQHGLPVNLFGDAAPNEEWMIGFNRGVLVHIEQFGPIWNSRIASIQILLDLPEYFRQHVSKAKLLKVNGPPLELYHSGCRLNLVEEKEHAFIMLEAQSLFKDPKIVNDVMSAYRSGPPQASIPTTPQLPLLGPGKELVSLWVFADARSIECLPGPVGSHLVIFRFSGIPQYSLLSLIRQICTSPAGEVFIALDIQLHCWIPGQLVDGVWV